MSLESPELGLRALYGTISVMNPLVHTGNRVPVFTFEYFIHIFKNYEGLSLVDAVDVLRLLYGTDRRVLVIVDEISKAAPIGADGYVLSTLASLLDRYDIVDILISSLSPQYITNLAKGSNRYIDYIPLVALIDSDLGQSHCIEWAGIMTKHVIGDNKVYYFNILKSIYILLSGHPRSIEYLVESFIPYYDADGVVEKDVSEVGLELMTLTATATTNISAINTTTGSNNNSEVYEANQVNSVWQPLSDMINRQASGSVVIGEIIRTINRIGNIQYNTKAIRNIDVLEFILTYDDMPDEELIRQYIDLSVIFATTSSSSSLYASSSSSSGSEQYAMRLVEFLFDLNAYINRPMYSSKVTERHPRLNAAVLLFTKSFNPRSRSGSGSAGLSRGESGPRYGSGGGAGIYRHLIRLIYGNIVYA